MFDLMMLRSRSVPSDPPRRRGASVPEPERDPLGFIRSLLAAVPWVQSGLGILVLVIAGMVPWATGEALNALDRPIGQVSVSGDLTGEDRTAVEAEASKWIGRSFFATDLARVKAEVETRPWVESAAVSRAWPDRLQVEIREKQPLAYWNEGQLISLSGRVFQPDNPEVAGRLPRLSGPDERVREVVTTAREMAEKLAQQGIGFAGLQLEDRGAWTLILSNGIEVALGRDQVGERFERFMTVYQGQLAARAHEVKRVDARYTNGVAVRWKAPDSPTEKNS